MGQSCWYHRLPTWSVSKPLFLLKASEACLWQTIRPPNCRDRFWHRRGSRKHHTCWTTHHPKLRRNPAIHEETKMVLQSSECISEDFQDSLARIDGKNTTGRWCRSTKSHLRTYSSIYVHVSVNFTSPFILSNYFEFIPGRHSSPFNCCWFFFSIPSHFQPTPPVLPASLFKAAVPNLGLLDVVGTDELQHFSEVKFLTSVI